MKSFVFDLDHAVVHFPARVNAANIAEVLSRLEQVRARRFILDLAETQSLDSTALGAIVKTYRRQLERGGDVVLGAPSEGVRRIMAVTRLDGVLPTAPSLEAARTLEVA
jgi:anti-anti-sigma factor